MKRLVRSRVEVAVLAMLAGCARTPGGGEPLFEVSQLIEAHGLDLELFQPLGERPDEEIGAALVPVVVGGTGRAGDLIGFLDDLERMSALVWADDFRTWRLDEDRIGFRFEVRIPRVLDPARVTEGTDAYLRTRALVVERWVTPARQRVRRLERELLSESAGG